MFGDDTRYKLLQPLFYIKLQVVAENFAFPPFFFSLQHHSPLGFYSTYLNKIIFFFV